jgi:AcrR family transcriptional regulator
LLREGHQPTVAEAAAAAGVHRGTAYRYFPTPQALLTDAALTAGAPDPAEMYRGIPDDDALALMDAGVRAVSDYMFREEALFRSIVRVTIDRWFAQQGSTDPDPPPVRQTRRFGPIDRALEPLRGKLSPRSLRRLRYALCLVYGAEALIVTRDVADDRGPWRSATAARRGWRHERLAHPLGRTGACFSWWQPAGKARSLAARWARGLNPAR